MANIGEDYETYFGNQSIAEAKAILEEEGDPVGSIAELIAEVQERYELPGLDADEVQETAGALWKYIQESQP